MGLPPPPRPEGPVAPPPSSPFWTSAPASRRRPSKAWYWLAASLATVGFVLIGGAVWIGVAGFHALTESPRVGVPGRAEVTLEAGDYTVYYEAPGVADDDVVRAPSGPVDVAVPSRPSGPVPRHRPG